MEGFARRLGGTLGRAKIVNLPPGRRVLAHVDRGDYYARRDRYHLVVESDGCRMRAGDEEVVMGRGELWWFDNKAEHEAWNETASPRIHLIFDVEPPSAD
jgi:aspartyl/asparaginyl beta-hydroxylase (cupin superfamily)